MGNLEKIVSLVLLSKHVDIARQITKGCGERVPTLFKGYHTAVFISARI